MFNKLSPTPITNQTHRRLLIFSMIWFFSGAWIDSSAHTYLIDDIETFFTPWHGVLYSGYAFSVLVAMYIKNKIWCKTKILETEQKLESAIGGGYVVLENFSIIKGCPENAHLLHRFSRNATRFLEKTKLPRKRRANFF